MAMKQVQGGGMGWFSDENEKLVGPACTGCGSTKTKSMGMDANGRVQYKCTKCGATFYIISTNMIKA